MGTLPGQPDQTLLSHHPWWRPTLKGITNENLHFLSLALSLPGTLARSLYVQARLEMK